MSKATGLAAFTRGRQEFLIADAEPETLTPVRAAERGSGDRKRGKTGVVALTVRLQRADWERLHHLAISEGVSIQTLAMRGFNSLFEEKGLPKLAS